MSHRLEGFKKESDRRELEKNFTFAATFWLEDPLRDGVKQILGDLKNAGSSTVILSGDHEATVVKTIEELGLNDIEGAGDPRWHAHLCIVKRTSQTLGQHQHPVLCSL